VSFMSPIGWDCSLGDNSLKYPYDKRAEEKG
jgi:hypothetical protein